MKIAIFTHNYPVSIKDRQNAGVFVFDIAQELSRKAEVWVFCPHEKKNGTQKIGKTNVYWFKRGTKDKLGSVSLKNPLGLISIAIFFLRGQIASFKFHQKIKPEISIAMWAWPSGFFVLLNKLFFRTPYVVWALGSDINKYSKIPVMSLLFKQILGRSDFLYADGVQLARDVSDFSGKECIFLPSATKMKKVNNKINKDKNKITLTFLGRMEKVKGPDVFLDALIINRKDLSKFQINFIGDGSLLESLKTKAQKNNIAKYIEFNGNICDKQEIARILSRSDWLVIPSRSDSIPLVFSEAMKNNVPIIAANLTDLKHVINLYKVGYLFKAGNSKSLANIIKKLSSSKKGRNVFVNNTQIATKDFSVEKSSNKLYNCSTNIINNHYERKNINNRCGDSR